MDPHTHTVEARARCVISAGQPPRVGQWKSLPLRRPPESSVVCSGTTNRQFALDSEASRCDPGPADRSDEALVRQVPAAPVLPPPGRRGDVGQQRGARRARSASRCPPRPAARPDEISNEMAALTGCRQRHHRHAPRTSGALRPAGFMAPCRSDAPAAQRVLDPLVRPRVTAGRDHQVGAGQRSTARCELLDIVATNRSRSGSPPRNARQRPASSVGLVDLPVPQRLSRLDQLDRWTAPEPGAAGTPTASARRSRRRARAGTARGRCPPQHGRAASTSSPARRRCVPVGTSAWMRTRSVPASVSSTAPPRPCPAAAARRS